ncbi:YhcN/YlaJ family sporulation lipoprotein [Peptococcaceae bacterium 1198_IL3148]
MYAKKSAYILLSFIFLVSLIFGGCTAAEKPAPQQPVTPEPVADDIDNRNQNEDPENNKYQSQPASNDQAIKIASIVDDVPGVVKSQVVVAGSTAYIGLDLNSNMNVNESEVKKMVDDKVRNENPNLNSLYITTDPDTIERLRDINQGIAEGKPSSTYDFDALEENFKKQ